MSPQPLLAQIETAKSIMDSMGSSGIGLVYIIVSAGIATAFGKVVWIPERAMSKDIASSQAQCAANLGRTAEILERTLMESKTMFDRQADLLKRLESIENRLHTQETR